jgi:hypothetical protein
MAQYAFVTWVETAEPWMLEKHLLASGLNLPQPAFVTCNLSPFYGLL